MGSFAYRKYVRWTKLQSEQMDFLLQPTCMSECKSKAGFLSAKEKCEGIGLPRLASFKIYSEMMTVFLRWFGETDLGDEYWQRFCHFSTYLITSYCYFHFICMFTKVYQNNPYPYWCYSLENVWIRMNVFTRDKFERFRMHRQKYMKMFTFTHTFSTFVAMNTIQV